MNKMGESKVSTLSLEQSVSFGKFENDSLSWEKWSSFSPNKYLDEVEKCSTPGSVAEKKAYFEAHYKKIAAKKAELEQDNPVECAPARSDELTRESHIDETGLSVDEFDVRVADKSNVEAEQIAQQKAYFEELYIKMADRMGEHVEQDTPMQYTYPMLDELKHGNHTDNMSPCNSELKPCSDEKHTVEVDQIAQKKAYFEAQLKKIDGSRPKRLEQDKPLRSAHHKFDESQHKNHTESPHASDCAFDGCVGKEFTKQVEQEEVVVIEAKDLIVNDGGEKQEFSVGECLSSSIEETKEDLIISRTVYTEKVEQDEVVGIEVKDTTVNDGQEKQEISAVECLSNSTEEAKEDLTISQSDYSGSSASGVELVIVEEPSCVVNPSNLLKLDKKVEKEAKTAPGKEVKKLKVKEQNITPKKVLPMKEQPLSGMKKTVVPSAAKSSLVSSSRSPKLAPSSAAKAQPLTGTKKKLVSSAAKSSPISTPRPSKLAPPSLMSASKLSSKKLNATYLPRNKNTTPVGENKRAGPTSLHMSLNLGSSDLSVEPASARKSLIMEKMADKDIIKRAFSSFKNNFQELRSSHDAKSIRASKVLDQKVTTLPPKDSEGVVCHEENKRGKAFLPSVDSKSDTGAKKPNDVLKKLGQKPITRKMEKVQIPTKSKGEDGELKLLKKNSGNSKLTHSKG